MDERRIRADRRGDGNAAVADLERAGVIDAEGDLHERAGLAEEDQRLDAGECGLSELRDRRFLPVARLDLGAKPLQFCIRVRRVAAPADEMERMRIVGHCNRGSLPQGFEDVTRVSRVDRAVCETAYREVRDAGSTIADSTVKRRFVSFHGCRLVH